MTTEEQHTVQKIMNWFTMSNSVSSGEPFSLLMEEKEKIESELNGQGTALVYEWFNNFSDAIIASINEKFVPMKQKLLDRIEHTFRTTKNPHIKLTVNNYYSTVSDQPAALIDYEWYDQALREFR